MDIKLHQSSPSRNYLATGYRRQVIFQFLVSEKVLQKDCRSTGFQIPDLAEIELAFP